MTINELAKIAYKMGYFVISQQSVADATKDFTSAGEETEAHHVKDFMCSGLHRLSHGIVSVEVKGGKK